MSKFSQKLAEFSGNGALESGKTVFDVNRLVAKAATYYEKVRYLVDFKEDHMVRRNALERIIKRKTVIEGGEASGISLLQELASGQYIGEEIVTEEMGRAIDAIISRFVRLEKAPNEISSRDRKRLISFAATEIEHAIHPLEHTADHSLVDAFYETMRSSIVLPGIPEREIDLMLYCACHRALLRSDDEALSYALWLKMVPEWKDISDEKIQEVDARLSSIVDAIDTAIKNTVQWKLVQRLRNYTIYFLIIRELVHKYGTQSGHILENEAELESFTKGLLEEKYAKENARIRSSGIRAVLYLFFTKAIFAIGIELPYELIFFNAISYLSLGINIVFHPLLLLLATRGVGTFGEKNSELIIRGMREVFYEGKVERVKIRTGNTALTYVFSLVYFTLLGVVFGGIVAGLHAIHFNAISIAIFLFFLALVSYFAFRIRYNARRWKITTRDSALSLIGSIFTVPIIRTGRWLSQTFASINVFVLIMDFIIETPFKLVLNFSNQFISYLKEKTPEAY